MGRRQIKGEWLLVCGENFMSLQPQYKCSVCTDIISTYDPPNVCEQCGSINKYKGNSILVSIKDEQDIFDIGQLDFQQNSACITCSSNPKNGGSGICHCILGQQAIY